MNVIGLDLLPLERSQGAPMPKIVDRIPFECKACGETFTVLPCTVRKAEKKGHGVSYCSMECRTEGYRGEGNPKWRGGTYENGSGYIYQHAPDHPHATQDGYVMQHRLVMEEEIGRHLTPEEQVHHINHDRQDNRPENLELMASVSEHRTHHGYFEEVECLACGTPVKRSRGHRERWKGRAYCNRECAAYGASMAAAGRPL